MSHRLLKNDDGGVLAVIRRIANGQLCTFTITPHLATLRILWLKNVEEMV